MVNHNTRHMKGQEEQEEAPVFLSECAILQDGGYENNKNINFL